MSDVSDVRQTVERMPVPNEGMGPHFPSGMNTVEAALSGATAGMSDDQIARLRGEGPAAREGTELEAGAEADAGTEEYEALDPGEYTIDQVVAYVDENPDEVEAVLAAEKAGKNRTTLVTQLEARQA